MNPLAMLVTSLLFAVCAWTGTLLADALCAGRAPSDDGPSPIAVPRWTFVAAAALVGAALGAEASSPVHVAVCAVAILALAGCAAADFACGMLPDVLTLGPLALVTGIGIATHAWSSLAGAAFVFLPFAAAAHFSHGRGMGWGDAKLAAFGGAFLGARDATVAFIVAALAAYVVTRASRRAKQPIAFGPYLAASIATMSVMMGAQ